MSIVATVAHLSYYRALVLFAFLRCCVFVTKQLLGAKACVVLFSILLKPRLHDTTCCQTGCQTGFTADCIVYTNIQPVVKHV